MVKNDSPSGSLGRALKWRDSQRCRKRHWTAPNRPIVTGQTLAKVLLTGAIHNSST